MRTCPAANRSRAKGRVVRTHPGCAALTAPARRRPTSAPATNGAASCRAAFGGSLPSDLCVPGPVRMVHSEPARWGADGRRATGVNGEGAMRRYASVWGLFFVVGCTAAVPQAREGELGDAPSAGAGCEPTTAPLYAGRTIEAGTVTIT